MSPRNFWNHPLQELARALVQTSNPAGANHFSTEEFTSLLGRLVGTAAQGPAVVSTPVSAVSDDSDHARLRPM